MLTKVAFFTGMLLLIIVPFIHAETPLSSCSNITQPGDYYLTNDVSSPDICMNITVSNVSLDCRDHMINFSQSSTNKFGVGIYAYQLHVLDNITIENCQLRKANDTLLYYHAMHLRVRNSRVVNNTVFFASPFLYQYAVALYLEADDTVVLNNTIPYRPSGSEAVEAGIKLMGRRNRLEGNQIISYASANSLRNAIYVSGEGNALISNFIKGYIYSALYLEYDAHNTTILSNHVIETEYGIYMISDNNSAVNNSFDSVYWKGIYVESRNSSIIGNTFSNPYWGYSIYFPFYTYGYYLTADYYHHTIFNNTENGKPILYYEGISNQELDFSSQNPAAVIVANANSLRIKNLNLSPEGLQLFFVNDSKITDSTVFSDIWLDGAALRLYQSHGNEVRHNNFSIPVVPWGTVIRLEHSDNNIVSDNGVASGQGVEIVLIRNLNTSIIRNNFTSTNTYYQVGSLTAFESSGFITDNQMNFENAGSGLTVSSSNFTIARNNITVGEGVGILLDSGSLSTVDSNIVRTHGSNSPAIQIYSSGNVSHNTLYTLHPTAQDSYGMVAYAQDVLIYDNIINTTASPPVLVGYWNASWNVGKQQGENIVGGPFIGGNFYARANGSGYSQTCGDENQDGICDTPLVHNVGNIDYLPLSKNSRYATPVLLVHGIYSDDSIWGAVEAALVQNGVRTFKVGQVLGQKGLVPNNGNILLLRHQLMDAIEKVKNETGASQVDIVAHSMGGLVARSYIQTPAYRGDIRKLITLGTPHFGAPIAGNKKVDKGIILLDNIMGLLGDEPESSCSKEGINDTQARCQMIPASPFLNELNKNLDNSTKGVDIFAVAGTESDATWLIEPEYFLFPSDAIVPTWSSSGFFRYTTEYDYTAHTSFLGRSSYYNNQTVIASILNNLRSGAQVNNEQGDGQAMQQDNLQKEYRSGFMEENSTLTMPVFLSDPSGADMSATHASFAVQWNQGNMSLSLVSPSGMVFNDSTDQTHANNQEKHVEYYVIKPAEYGNWTVIISANNATEYNVTVLAATKLTLSLLSNASALSPLQVLPLQVNLSNLLSPLLLMDVSAEIVKPDNEMVTVILYDDGTHNDSQPQDGVYGNVFGNTNITGMYAMTTQAQGMLNNTQFHRELSTNIFVQQLPDLFLVSKEIWFSPQKGHENQSVVITATIQNKGTADVNASISFYDGDPAQGGLSIGEVAAAFTAGGAVNLSIQRNFTGGFHTIAVFPSITNTFQDADYSNEKASAQLIVCPLPNPQKKQAGKLADIKSSCLV